MSTRDDDRDAEMTTDWPGTPHGDDGEATTVVPRTPHHGTPPPMSPPPSAPPAMSTPPMSPPPAVPWNPQWQNTPNAAPPPGGGWGPPVAPGQYPPGYPPAVVPKPRRGPRWGLIGTGAAALVVITAVAMVFIVRDRDSSSPAAGPTSTSAAPNATAAPPSPKPTSAAVIDPTALKGLLASVPELSELVGTAMEPNPIADAPFKGVSARPVECTGAVMPGVHSTFWGSGFTGFAGQILSDAPLVHKVIQTVASFPSDAEAKAHVDRQFKDWQSCTFTDVNIKISSAEEVGTVGATANTEGITSIFITAVGGAGRQCEHSMTVRKNVVVDVRVCTPSVGSMGWTLARDIGVKITGQR
jgi:serine/threonine kinase PknH